MPTAAHMRGHADVQPLPPFSETKQGRMWGDVWALERAASRNTLKSIGYSVNWWSRGDDAEPDDSST
jgi:hypothetical protein